MTTQRPSVHWTSILILVLLGAIWGSSFALMRVASPVLGPFVTANVRCLFAGLLLTMYVFLQGVPLDVRKNARHYFIVGLLQCAIPFVLFPYALRTLPPSYGGILNATSPLFSALFAWLLLGEPMKLRKLLGLLISVVGVALVVRVGSASIPQNIFFPVLACVLASVCYALAAIYVRKYTGHVKPMSLAAGSQCAAGLVLLPLSLIYAPTGPITTSAIASVGMLAVFCTAIAFLLFYHLIQKAGTTIAVSTGFLIPLFAMLWSYLLLSQPVSWGMVGGAALTLTGVFLVVYQPSIHRRQ